MGLAGEGVLPRSAACVFLCLAGWIRLAPRTRLATVFHTDSSAPHPAPRYAAPPSTVLSCIAAPTEPSQPLPEVRLSERSGPEGVARAALSDVLWVMGRREAVELFGPHIRRPPPNVRKAEGGAGSASAALSAPTSADSGSSGSGNASGLAGGGAGSGGARRLQQAQLLGGHRPRRRPVLWWFRQLEAAVALEPLQLGDWPGALEGESTGPGLPCAAAALLLLMPLNVPAIVSGLGSRPYSWTIACQCAAADEARGCVQEGPCACKPAPCRPRGTGRLQLAIPFIPWPPALLPADASQAAFLFCKHLGRCRYGDQRAGSSGVLLLSAP